MVDRADDNHAKLQKVLAEMRAQSDARAEHAVSPPSQTATSETPVAAPAPTLVPATPIRLVGVGDDALAIEVLDRTYPQIRRTFVHLAPGATGILDVFPDHGMVKPKAWSFRVRASNDPHLRCIAALTEVSIDSVLQLQIDRVHGIKTDELEADYYRMALDNGKEATLVARDISGFGVITKWFPLEIQLRNESDRHAIDILLRVWGEQGHDP